MKTRPYLAIASFVTVTCVLIVDSHLSATAAAAARGPYLVASATAPSAQPIVTSLPASFQTPEQHADQHVERPQRPRPEAAVKRVDSAPARTEVQSAPKADSRSSDERREELSRRLEQRRQELRSEKRAKQSKSNQ